jgi:hypothetical protein
MRGDYLERQVAESILSRIPSYATFWTTYVGNDGQQQTLQMPGVDTATINTREMIWQHLYSLFESLALCWQVEEEFKDREQINTLADYTWQLNAWTAFYAHLGRIHDMAERVTQRIGQQSLFGPFDDFYEQRNIALHGIKVPMRWVENVLSAPPLGEAPRQWHGKVWSDLGKADFEFLSHTMTMTLRSLEQVVEAFLSQVFSLAASRLDFRPIQWESRINAADQIIGSFETPAPFTMPISGVQQINDTSPSALE